MTANDTVNPIVDEIDKKILELLQENAKITVSKIAKTTEMSQTAIRSRIQRLEKSLIKKYVALIDCRNLGYREMVLASLRVNSSQPLEEIKTTIDQMAQIKYAYVVTGEYPLFVMFKCLGHEEALGLIETLRNLPGVEEIKTQIVLDRIKEDHSIIIP